MSPITSILTVTFGLLALSSNVGALGPVAIPLASAGNYAILSKSKIATSNTSAITGNIAVSPISHVAITGFSLVLNNAGTASTSTQVTGLVTAADYAAPTPATLTTAISDLAIAFGNGTGRAIPNFLNLNSGAIGGLTLAPALYKWSTTVTAANNFIISGTATDTWIFQIAQTLTLNPNVTVTLKGGALAKNVFWVVTGAVDIGAKGHMEGIILAATSITFRLGSSINGRLLAQTGVNLQNTAVVQPHA